MGINVSISKSGKNRNMPIVQDNPVKDLKSCMRCRYFHGNNNQCITTKCVKEPKKDKEEMDGKHICFQCPYKRSDNYCFPCMKKILGKDANKNEEMEEDEDG